MKEEHRSLVFAYSTVFALAVTLIAELFELAFIDKFEYTPNCVSYSVELSP